MSDMSVVLKNIVILDTLSDGDFFCHWYQVLKVFIWNIVQLLRMICTSCSINRHRKQG